MKGNTVSVYTTAACGALFAFQAHGVNLYSGARFEARTDRTRSSQRHRETSVQQAVGWFTQATAPADDAGRLAALITAAVAAAANGDWEGCGNFRVADDVVTRAYDLATLLPTGLPDPDVYVMESGGISFDWAKTTKAQLSVMVLAEGGIAFASYLRGNRAHGAFAFDPGQLPEEIDLALQKWSAFDPSRLGAIGPRAA
jgi:hypothetical protein